MQGQQQKMNQNDAPAQNTGNKTEQKIYNAFSNVFMNKMQNQINKHEQFQIQQTLVTIPQNKQVQQSLEEVDFNLLSENNSGESYANQQNGKESTNNINFEYIQPEVVEIPKKLIKKAGKRDIVSFQQKSNSPIENTKENNNRKKQQILSQNTQQFEQQQITKVSKPYFSSTKINNQIDTSQMVRIKPQIKIYQDKKLKQSLKESMDDEIQSIINQLKLVNFCIEIPLLSQHKESNRKNNQVFQRKMMPSNKLNPFNKFSNQQHYNQDISESNELLHQHRQHVEKVRQIEQQGSKVRNNKTKISAQQSKNDSDQIKPVQFKQSKIKNNFNRQTILRASMTQETSLKSQKADQDLYTRNNKQTVNLAKVTLKDLVKELYLKKIINEGLYKQFIQNHSIHDIKDYIIKFQQGKLHKFDYQNIKFTILDHRRISQLFVNLYAQYYMIGTCYHSDPQILDFMTKLYDLGAQEYYSLYKKVDNISGLKWWSKILITQDERLMEVNKDRRIARRKAEQATIAVQELIQNARKKSTVPDTKLSQSQANSDKTGSNISIYKDHSAFFGQSDQVKELTKKRRQQIRELVQIRQMVSNNFSSKPAQNQESDGNKPTMRKKIRFY